jgi:hypothetical protein
MRMAYWHLNCRHGDSADDGNGRIAFISPGSSRQALLLNTKPFAQLKDFAWSPDEFRTLLYPKHTPSFMGSQ